MFFNPLDSYIAVAEGEVLKTVCPYARDLETFLIVFNTVIHGPH